MISINSHETPAVSWVASVWGRAIVGVVVIAYWAALVPLLGNLGSFPQHRDATAIDAVLWVGIGVAGFGIFAAVTLVHVASGVPLVPGWSLGIVGSLSLLVLFMIVGLYDRGPGHTRDVGSSIGPPLTLWPPFLSFVTTSAVLAAAFVHRLVRRFKRVSGAVAVLAGVLRYPLFAAAVSVSGGEPFATSRK